MKRARRRARTERKARPILAATAAFAILAACGGGDGGSGGGAGHGGSASVGGASGTGGGVVPGGNNPTSGCLDGYVDCGDVCAHIQDDSINCGMCHHVCDTATEGCVDGTCVAGEGCLYGTTRCGDRCLYTSYDLDNCGSCENRCGDHQWCSDEPMGMQTHGTCVDLEGDGTSCAAPVLLDHSEQSGFEFRMSAALTGEHRFSCGPLEQVPTRWFRLQATGSDLDLDLRTDYADALVVEVFSDPSCKPSASIACSAMANSSHGISLSSVPVTDGKEYFIAVGVTSTWSGHPLFMAF